MHSHKQANIVVYGYVSTLAKNEKDKTMYVRYEIRHANNRYYVDRYDQPDQTWEDSISLGYKPTLKRAQRVIKRNKKHRAKIREGIVYREENGYEILPDVREIADV